MVVVITVIIIIKTVTTTNSELQQGVLYDLTTVRLKCKTTNFYILSGGCS